MYGGSLDTSDVLLNRGLNGGYGYGHQGNFLGDGSAVKESVRGNRDIQLLESVNGNAQAAGLSQQIRQHNDIIQGSITTGNQFLTDRIASQSLNDRFASIDRLILAHQASTEREFRTLDVKLTECCCELKAGQAAVIAKLDSQALQEAQAENQRLQIQIINQGRGNSGN